MSSQVPAGQGGPGTIEPGVQFVFNSVGPAFENLLGNVFFREIGNLGFAGVPDTNFLQDFRWGSFDGTTNAPVVYPSSVSIASLESEIYFQIITPLPLPQGKVGSPYNTNGFQLQGTGGTLPYTWATTTSGLPAGLRLSTSGIISGTPTTAGTNDFVVQLMDAGQRTVTQDLVIGVSP